MLISLSQITVDIKSSFELTCHVLALWSNTTIITSNVDGVLYIQNNYRHNKAKTHFKIHPNTVLPNSEYCETLIILW